MNLKMLSPKMITPSSAPELSTSETSVLYQAYFMTELLGTNSARRLKWTLSLKEIVDFSLAAILLVITSPILLGCMILVRVTSRGPSIYSQQRVGRFGKVFVIYKIRTMQHECESLTGPRWCIPKDPRVTKIGRILRKLHLDELPQLWNILKGEMSLIGPRPERPEIAKKLVKLIPGYNLRLLVKPGITGEAQIHVPPDTGLHTVRAKLVYDRLYIRNISLWNDLRILFMTILKTIGLISLDIVPEDDDCDDEFNPFRSNKMKQPIPTERDISFRKDWESESYKDNDYETTDRELSREPNTQESEKVRIHLRPQRPFSSIQK